MVLVYISLGFSSEGLLSFFDLQGEESFSLLLGGCRITSSSLDLR